MPELSDFFLELANESRLKILLNLKTKDLRLTQLSQALKLSMPETSRHLSRLRTAKLIRKSTEGIYRISDFGQIVLHLIPSYNFIYQNRPYFAMHPLNVPPQLLSRIGEMENSVRIREFVCAISLIESCTKRAEKTIGLMCEQMLSSNAPTIQSKIVEGASFYCLISNKYVSPFNLTPPGNGNVGIRTAEEVNNFILLTEKEAVVAFADKFGKIDYSEVFHATDESSRLWCAELLSYFWEKATPQKNF